MISEILALNLLGYSLLYALYSSSKKRFKQIVGYSKITEIIAIIISMIAILTIIFGFMTFISVLVLTITNSNAFTQTMIDLEFEETPVMMFLTLIGAIALIYGPFFTIGLFPIYGRTKK